jgi:hypothetical protein
MPVVAALSEPSTTSELPPHPRARSRRLATRPPRQYSRVPVQSLVTSELLAQLATAGPDRLAAILELTRRRELTAARPLIKLLREELTEPEVDAIFAALAVLGSRGIMPLLQHTAKTRPALADRLMALHALIKRPAEAKLEQGLRWVAVGGGRVAIGGRPKLRALTAMRDEGATHIVTLLCEGEDARELGAAVTAAGLGWQWLPRRNGDPPADHEDAAIAAALDAWLALLAGGASLYIHCAAGIHRTGMLTHALLRRAGHAPADAQQLLAALRTLTAAEAGAHRLAWGHRFAPAP